MEYAIKKLSRIDSIDFWRGVILVSIFINHIPGNVLEGFTHKNIGFSDATEAFVFLSGLSVALAYGRRFIAGEQPLPFRAIRRRITTVYGVQLFLSLAAVAMFLTAAFLFEDDGLLADHGRDIVLDKPLKALLAIAGLSHQIGYFNILPLYIVLLAATPALLALARHSSSLMLGTSFAIYILARHYEINLPTWPVEGHWFFNPFAWQLLYCIGLFTGLNLHIVASLRSRALFMMAFPVIVLSLIIATGFFSLHPDLRDAAKTYFDLDKTDLGLARLLHFLAMAYVIFHLGIARLLAWAPFYKPLCLIGRHSLPVFAAGSLLSAFGQIIQYSLNLAWADEMALILAGIGILYAVARTSSGTQTAQS